MLRTIENGKLRLEHVGENVELVGWVAKRRNLGSLIFIDLRDRTGIIQLIVKTDEISVPEVRNEYVIHVKGVVRKKDVANPLLKTGEVEVEVSELQVINKAETTPLIIADETDALEEVRLKYRYLDLRRPIMQKRLKTRAQIVQSTHEFLNEHDFIEVETPILTKSTPGGARDFLVPSRLHPGSYYALPQSPQIYKQLLMIGGFERYYQIARCFRDEDLRSDRQPDFTQIDIETAFLSQDEFLNISEQLIAKIFKDTVDVDVKLPFRRMTYAEAMDKYGSDKPDTRFDMFIEDIKYIFSSNQGDYYKNNTEIRAIVVSNIASATTRKKIDEASLIASRYGLKGVAVLKYLDDELSGSLLKTMSEEEIEALIKKFQLKNDDIVVIAAHNRYDRVVGALGALRLHYAKETNLIDKNTYDILWIVDFPLFELNENDELASRHHPFTLPKAKHLPLLESDPLQVNAEAFDLVINGQEAGGGSMRIYEQDLQRKIFEVLGMSEEEIRFKFGFFVDAFKYGTPPHGGIAFGLDRLTMILTGTNNIRDVIAFPKNIAGVSQMSGEPTPVDQVQLDDLYIKNTHKK
ncbi:MAG: aspartate--tRNA ligase [Erysipelotrichaceae bacterium]|nr:aspartate--tRNA ligase [Erysipelotrichaceae bacterium]